MHTHPRSTVLSPQPIHCVLLRGLAREAAHWGDFIDQLQVAQPHWHIQCVDFPGFGTEWLSASPTNISGIADHVESLLPREKSNASGITRPTLVIALSLGGMVALDLLARKSIDHAVLINSSSNLNPAWQRMKPRALPSMLAALLTPSITQQEKWILHQVCNSPETRLHTLPHWLRIQKKRPISRSNTVRQLLAAARYTAPSYLEGTKLTLLASQRDKLVSVTCSQKLAKEFRAKVVLHPLAGHDIPLEDPDWVIDHCINAAKEMSEQRRLLEKERS